MNINKLIQRQQRRLMAILVGGIVLGIAVLLLVNRQTPGHAASETGTADNVAREPDLTGGAVTNTFAGAGQNALLLDAQRREQQAKDSLARMQQTMNSLQDKINEAIGNNQLLQQRVDTLMATREQPGASGKVPLPAAAQTGGPPQRHDAADAVQPGQIENVLLKASPSVTTGKDTSFWVPTGTFSDAMVIEGADANASVRGENNLVPLQLKLKGPARMPGNQRLTLFDNCFVTAAAFGDISSERAIVRLQRLSCIINGKHIDQPVKGHVAFYGKNGIKGVPVMRNGNILGLAFVAGALGGLGQSVSQVGQAVAGLGATARISGGAVARSAVGGGVGRSADKLADYYIERAEQYHPIIPIGAANRVEVVFIEGFRATFIEDEEAAKAASHDAKTVRNVATRDDLSADLPPELAGKLGDATRLNVSDFVIPTTGKGPASAQAPLQGAMP